MPGDEYAAKRSFGAAAKAILKPWLSPRRARFWAVVAVLVYTLAGFFLLPWWLGNALVDGVRTGIGHETAVGKVRANPYVLSLEVDDFSIADPDGTTWSGFERLRVNFQLSSLFRRAWTFREIRLEGADLLFERFASGETRLQRVLSQRPASETGTPPAAVPRFLVHELAITGARLRFRDALPREPVSLDFGPIAVAAQAFSTLPEPGGSSVSMQLPGGGSVALDGQVRLAPVELSGHLRLRSLELGPALAYAPASTPLQSLAATLSLETDYRLAWSSGAGIDVELDRLGGALAGIAVSGLSPAAEFLSVQQLSFSGGALRLPEQRFDVEGLRIEGLSLDTWMQPDGALNLLALRPPDGGQDGAGDGNAAAAAVEAGWAIGVGKFELAGGRLGFEDRRREPHPAFVLDDVALTVSGLGNQSGAQFPVTASGTLQGGGSLSVEGQAAALPEASFEGTVQLAGIALPLAQPYVAELAKVRVEAGTLAANAAVKWHAAGEQGANGDLAVEGLSVIDTIENQPLFGFARMTVDAFEADPVERSLRLSQVGFQQPYGRLVILPELETNLDALAVAALPDSAATPDGEASGWSLRVARMTFNDGALDFSDLSLPLPFSTHVQELNGRISSIDTQSAAPADIQLEGQVDEYGMARATGTMATLSPLADTDIGVEFRNVRMSSLSPYTVSFAGREIDEGKLDLELNYRIVSGRLDATHNIVMSDLVLGKEVESPGAASLPLGLAVALLKDANGVIDIDLPVEGDFDDPEFRLGGVIWQAVVGLLTKIVTAPFRLLGGLVGGSADDLGRVEFLAGRSDLTPPEREKIAQLQAALKQRPELGVAVPGVFAADVDAPALRFLRLRDAVIARLGADSAAVGSREAMLDTQVREVLEQLHAERFPDVPLETLRATHSAPPADDPEGEPVLDELAYAADLRDRLLEAEPVGQPELEALAAQRAATIRDALLADPELAPDRVSLAQATEGESEDGEWVVMELEAKVD